MLISKIVTKPNKVDSLPLGETPAKMVDHKGQRIEFYGKNKDGDEYFVGLTTADLSLIVETVLKDGPKETQEAIRQLVGSSDA